MIAAVRLWSIHPRYLDSRGLVALWREGLLALAVLGGRTRGYRFHPQLERFREQPRPLAALRAYLRAVHVEALARGYAFDRRKLGRVTRVPATMRVSRDQLRYEWQHLLGKLAHRDPALHARFRTLERPRCHPLFRAVPGRIEPWERTR